MAIGISPKGTEIPIGPADRQGVLLGGGNPGLPNRSERCAYSGSVMSLFGSHRYPEVLHALRELLARCGEAHWANWIEQDLEEWNRSRSVSHHLSAYGSMGSLSDVSLIPEKCGAQSVEAHLWISALFEELKSVSYLLAGQQQHGVPFFELTRLRASLPAIGKQLTGWTCEPCGYTEVSQLQVTSLIARTQLRKDVLDALADGRMAQLVSHVSSGEPVPFDEEWAWIWKAIHDKGIALQHRTGGMRPCPRCNSESTAVSYWIVDTDEHSVARR